MDWLFWLSVWFSSPCASSMCIFPFLITHVFVLLLLFVLGFFVFLRVVFHQKLWCFLRYYLLLKKGHKDVIKKTPQGIEDIHKSDAQLYALFPSSLCHLILTLHLSLNSSKVTYLPTYLNHISTYLLNVLTYHHVRYLSTYAMYPPTQYTYHLSTYQGSQHAIPHISYPCNYLGYRLTYLVKVPTYLPTNLGYLPTYQPSYLLAHHLWCRWSTHPIYLPM